MKSIEKKSSRNLRERKVLFGLIDFYLKTGRPVGSNTLKETEFQDLSSATIRNYFANLENEGYLIQQHSSGGRIPSNQAYRLYAKEYSQHPFSDPIITTNPFEKLKKIESREISAYLHLAAEELATQTHTAVFLSAPRFEQDFILSIKLMIIDNSRCLCLLITDFGQIITEILQTDHKISSFTSKRIEAYFNWRITGQKEEQPTLTNLEHELARRLYNELMLRYIVSHSNYYNEEIYRTAFSTLFDYPEFHDPTLLTNSLSLFEHTDGMRHLLKECCKQEDITFWIGEDLKNYSPNPSPNCSVVAIPYYVNGRAVGAVGLLGPLRFPYRPSFALLKHFSDSISAALTHNLFKFKIEMRQTKQRSHQNISPSNMNTESNRLLIEDKRHKQQNKQLARKK